MKVRLSLTEKEAEMLFAAASQMEDDAEEHYGKRDAAAFQRAFEKLRYARFKVRLNANRAK